MTISNRISLDELRRMAVGDIAALPAEQLALLQDEAADALRRAKTVCDWLDGAVALKYGDRAHATRQAAGKDTGTIRFDDGAVTVIADLPKRGFGMPFGPWVKGPMRELAAACFDERRAAAHGVLDRRIMPRLRATHEAGRLSGWRVWLLMVLQRWLELNKVTA